MSEPTWEDVTPPGSGDYLERIEVPGGWLYRTTFARGDHGVEGVAMSFVPRPIRKDPWE